MSVNSTVFFNTTNNASPLFLTNAPGNLPDRGLHLYPSSRRLPRTRYCLLSPRQTPRTRRKTRRTRRTRRTPRTQLPLQTCPLAFLLVGDLFDDHNASQYHRRETLTQRVPPLSRPKPPRRGSNPFVIPVRWRPYLALAVFFVTLWLMFELSTNCVIRGPQAPALGDISNGCVMLPSTKKPKTTHLSASKISSLISNPPPKHASV